MSVPTGFYGTDYDQDGNPVDRQHVADSQREPPDDVDEHQGDEQPDTDSWQPIDLAPYLDGTAKPAEPSVGLVRRDGLTLLYPGKEHTVIGEMEAGKSWFSLACAQVELGKGNHVVYVHFEESDPADTVQRLQALGVDNTAILQRFRFVGPDRKVTTEAWTQLLDPAPSLVILDGVNEAMALHGMGIRDEDGAALYRGRLVKPGTNVGAAVLSADHVVKDREARGRGPLGSIHKGNGLTGSLILMENADPFGRGERGCSHMFVTKDRPGALRRHGQPTRTPGRTFMGSLLVDDTRVWVDALDVTFVEPKAKADDEDQGDEGDKFDTHVLGVVIELFDSDQPTNTTSIRATAKANNAKTKDALTRLVLARYVTEQPHGNSTRFHPTETGRLSFHRSVPKGTGTMERF